MVILDILVILGFQGVLVILGILVVLVILGFLGFLATLAFYSASPDTPPVHQKAQPFFHLFTFSPFHL